MSVSGSPPAGVVVTADQVRRTYRTSTGTVAAVAGVSLSVRAGEVVGISGPSGCGKSTLLRILAGLEPPDAGDVHYAGAPAWPRRRGPFGGRRARDAAYPRPGYVMAIFQDPFASVDPRWPVWRTVTEPLTVGGGRPSVEERRRAARSWLARADLGHVAPDARPEELSGGQCQRVALVRALVARPSLVVADEPTARQDVINAAAVTRLLREAADDGAAVVVVSHDVGRLATVADRVVPMADGRLAD